MANAGPTDNISIAHCIIKDDNNTSSNNYCIYAYVYGASGGGHINLENNHFYKAKYGAYIYGDASNTTLDAVANMFLKK